MKTTSLETSRRLAGQVKIETEYWWQIIGDRKPKLVTNTNTGDSDKNDITEWIPAYTTDELMEWLPIRNKYWEIPEKFSNDWWLRIEQCFIKGEKGYMVNYYGDDDDTKLLDEDIRSTSLPEALALLAEYVVDNKLV